MAETLLNTWTSGEISEDAWDRPDIQPVNKGCEEATNYVLRVAGPLGKRRGFWDLGAVNDQTQPARLIPFRRSVDDALMLEFSNAVVRVWQANGAPLKSGGAQVSFASPYAAGALAGLRYKQVADVIYLRHASGLAPRALVRAADNSWSFVLESFPNGPWRPENANPAATITVTQVTATSENDTTTGSTTGAILADGTVNLAATGFTFDPGQVGAYFRLRQNTGTPGVKTWSTGFRPVINAYCASAGRIYSCTTPGTVALVSGVDQQVTTPPVQTMGEQSDGSNVWSYRHDGAGVVRIVSYTDSTHVVAQVIAALPFNNGKATSAWSEGAYSDYRGWPRMWPAVVEERLVEGAVATGLDMLDMTETAGFGPGFESFTPGLGNGTVVDTDALRRRVSDDGGEVLWAQLSTFLILGTASGEHIASAGLFGAPLTPSSIVVRQISEYGSADVFPVRAHKGLLFVTRGGQALRKLSVDLEQNVTGDDYSFLATHIAERVFAQLAWVASPDEVLWARLADGGLAAMTNHEEQQVRGWSRQALPGGFLVEDIVSLPGPGRQETLWAVVNRTKAGAPQRHIWMLSRKDDGLFIDGAQLYAGAPATVIGGLANYNGETVRVLADGVQYQLVVAGGSVTLPAAAAHVQVGLGYATRFKSLKIAVGALMAALNLRQRPTQLVLKVKTALCTVSADGSDFAEEVCPRTLDDMPGAVSRALAAQSTLAISSDRDPRIVVEEDTAYDMVIYSLKPQVDVGG